MLVLCLCVVVFIAFTASLHFTFHDLIVEFSRGKNEEPFLEDYLAWEPIDFRKISKMDIQLWLNSKNMTLSLDNLTEDYDNNLLTQKVKKEILTYERSEINPDMRIKNNGAFGILPVQGESAIDLNYTTQFIMLLTSNNGVDDYTKGFVKTSCPLISSHIDTTNYHKSCSSKIYNGLCVSLKVVSKVFVKLYAKYDPTNVSDGYEIEDINTECIYKDYPYSNLSFSKLFLENVLLDDITIEVVDGYSPYVADEIYENGIRELHLSIIFYALFCILVMIEAVFIFVKKLIYISEKKYIADTFESTFFSKDNEKIYKDTTSQQTEFGTSVLYNRDPNYPFNQPEEDFELSNIRKQANISSNMLENNRTVTPNNSNNNNSISDSSSRTISTSSASVTREFSPKSPSSPIADVSISNFPNYNEKHSKNNNNNEKQSSKHARKGHDKKNVKKDDIKMLQSKCMEQLVDESSEMS